MWAILPFSIIPDAVELLVQTDCAAVGDASLYQDQRVRVCCSCMFK